ncbi:MAG TPA: HEPN domain-containing protein [Myxococcales bacterium]|jgi:HEPN domain-containing protein
MSAEKLRNESARWLAQSLDDFKAATVLLAANQFAQAGFYAQQAAEKAVKAVLISMDADPWGHSVAKLLEGAGQEFASLKDAAAALDKLYIPTRYPDALPDLIPAESYRRSEIERALSESKSILDACAARLKG